MHGIHRLLIFLAVFSLSIGSTFAQQQDKEQSRLYREQAELILKDTKAMDDARDIMVMAADFDTTSLQANFEAGSMHLQTIKKDLAVKFLLRVYRQKPEYRFDLAYWIGKSYHYGLAFDNAIQYYNIYLKKIKEKPDELDKNGIPQSEVERNIQECQNGKEFVAQPKNFAVIDMGSEINSEFDDYGPVFTADENEIIFTTRRKEGNTNEDVDKDNLPYEDIFTARRSNGVWSKAKNIGSPVNTKFYDSDLALSPDGNTLFIYKDEGKGNIYSTNRQADGTWSNPEPLEGFINSNYRESSISMSKDGNTIYFASERPGGQGGSDIYSSTKDSQGKWKEPVNLGPAINTVLDEEAPFIDFDGKTLYFSSKGGKGMGGFDIFKSTLLDPQKNEWSTPENLGYPINTPDNDVFYVVSRDGKRGYYASVKDDGYGYADIYMITVPEPKKEPVASKTVEATKPRKYTVVVRDAGAKQMIEAKVKLQGSRDKVVVGMSRKGLGIYEFSITEREAKVYQLSVESSGYVFVNQPVRIKGSAGDTISITNTVDLKKAEAGVSKVLKNIYFDFARASFKQESYDELNKLETMMKQGSGIKVEIAGHTDNIGTKDFNKQLSQLRANAVRDFLVSKGVDPRRVSPVGYGEERPMTSNDDEKEGRELNRRVEFKILGN